MQNSCGERFLPVSYNVKKYPQFLLILGFLIIHVNCSRLALNNCAKKLCTVAALIPGGTEGFQLM